MGVNYKKVGEAIRARRKELKFTQKQLAEILKISQGYISDLEKGDIENPSLKRLEIITEELQMDISKLFDASKEPEEEIDNPDIRAIARAGNKMTPDQATELKNLAERLFPNAFKDNS